MQQVRESIEFVQTDSDRIAACEMLLDRPVYQSAVRRARKQAYLGSLWGFLTVPLVFVGILNIQSVVMGGPIDPMKVWVGVFGGVGIAIGVFVYNGQYSRIRGMYRSAAIEGQRSQSGPGSDGPVRISFGDTGVSWACDGNSSQAEWPAFEEIFWNNSMGLAIMFNARMYIIPSRAFETNQAFEQFMNELQERNEAAGGVPGAIRRFLRHSSHVCVACGYEMSGDHEPICPECGRTIELADTRVLRDRGK